MFFPHFLRKTDSYIIEIIYGEEGRETKDPEEKEKELKWIGK
jgi:hypothetical protein